MAELNAIKMLQSIQDAGFLPPHPAGEITSRTRIIKSKPLFGFFKFTTKIEYWRLWIGDREYRDFDTREEAECARVLRGLPCLK